MSGIEELVKAATKGTGAEFKEDTSIIGVPQVCIIFIGVFSVYMQYNCVYYCDTCYVRV
jgi:hypothetical protein